MRPLALLAVAVLIAIPAHAAALININTADKATLMTLTGLGGTGVKAQAVIDYRNQHGPFSVIEDIMKVSGIRQATFDGFKAYITVGDTGAQAAASDTASTTVFTGGASTYVPPPSEISVRVSGPADATLEVPLALVAKVTEKNGSTDPAARVTWSWGDGSSGDGTAAEKTYHYPGTYLVTVAAADGTASAHDEIVVTVRAAQVRISAVSGDGITITNDSDDRLDLSSWRIRSSTGMFRIPQGTTILPHASVLFPFTVMNLPVAFDAVLTYPSGVVAAQYAPAPPAPVALVQPAAPAVSYKQVRAVEPITSVTDEQSHVEAVDAPAAATELAAAGAVGPVLAPEISSKGLLRSPWTYGFVGVMLAAAGAFVLL